MLTLLTIPTTEQRGSAEEKRELERLLSGVAAGDRDALAQLYHRTRTAVFCLALSVLKNAHDAQDVTQDTFVRVWERAAQYRASGSPMGWLLTVCRNEARMKLRREGRQTTLEDAQWEALPADCSGLSPEDRALLQQALASLEDGERQIVLLHAVTGLKHREIAALLEAPLSTVLSRYHRALKKLRVCLKGDDAR